MKDSKPPRVRAGEPCPVCGRGPQAQPRGSGVPGPAVGLERVLPAAAHQKPHRLIGAHSPPRRRLDKENDCHNWTEVTHLRSQEAREQRNSPMASSATRSRPDRQPAVPPGRWPRPSFWNLAIRLQPATPNNACNFQNLLLGP